MWRSSLSSSRRYEPRYERHRRVTNEQPDETTERIKVTVTPTDAISLMNNDVSVGDEQGFSLVELMIVLLVLSVLMGIGLVSYSRMTRIADHTGTQLDLLTAVKVQALQHLETGEFTTDVHQLFDLEPNLRYSDAGEPPGTLVVSSESGRRDIDVCVFSKTTNGDWFAIYHSVDAGDSYSESAPVQCTEANTASWSKDPW